MARTIYFNDGSREVLLCGDNEKQELERILPKDAAMAVYRHYHPEEGKQ